MKAKYENDVVAGPGHGKLVLTELMAPDSPLQIALQRGSDRYFATDKADGFWTPETNFIDVEGQDTDSGVFEIFISPDLADLLDPQEIYRLQLKGADGAEQCCAFTTGPVIKSDNADLIRKKEKPQGASPKERASAEKSESSVKKAVGVLETKKPEMPKAAATSAVSRSWLRHGMILVLFVVCGIWYWLDYGRERLTESPDPVAEARVAVIQPDQEAASVDKQVAEFFSKPDRTSEMAVELARKLSPNMPEEKDAVYRLYYYAADKENPEGLLLYGQCLDPSLPAWGGISKDGFLAWQAYGDAADKNAPQAAQARQNLEKWLAENAVMGDAVAKKWLKQVEDIKKQTGK